RDIGRDLAPLATAIDEMQTRLDSMENETGGSNRPSRQVSLVLAVGNLASAVRTSSPYASELAAVPGLLPPGAGAGDVIATLDAYADSGAPTAAQLTQQFAGLTGPALQAIHLNDQQSTLEQALGQLQALITVRRSPGEVEGDDPPALLARAEHRLRNGDVSGAYGLTERLPEPAQEALNAWREQALARITVDQAIDQLIGLAASTSAGGQ
ncbi:MAG: mitofilin family membrane protein, partial [Pseudomonadota bacterium]